MHDYMFALWNHYTLQYIITSKMGASAVTEADGMIFLDLDSKQAK